MYFMMPNTTSSSLKPLVDLAMGGIENMMNTIMSCPAGQGASARIAQ
jgi:hypothetical protein